MPTRGSQPIYTVRRSLLLPTPDILCVLLPWEQVTLEIVEIASMVLAFLISSLTETQWETIHWWSINRIRPQTALVILLTADAIEISVSFFFFF